MDKLVSIIIPVYNVRNYLKDCIDSVINQTYKNIEILLIDDGSVDGSSEICDEYKTLDSRIVVIHKKNGGLSDARNVGIDLCKGDYIYFLDSDDYLEKDAIEILLNSCEYFGKQIALTNYRMFIGEIVEEKNIEKKYEYEELSTMDSIKTMLLPGKYDHCACAKMYDRKLWDSIRFPKGKLYEDLYTIYDIFQISNGCVYCDFPKYNYRTRPDSIMNSPIKYKDLELLDISDMVADKLKNWYPDLNEIIVNHRVITYANFLVRVLKSNDGTYKATIKRIVQVCRENQSSCLKSKYMRVNDKIKVFIICRNYHFYLLFYKIGLIFNRLKKIK